MIMSPSNSKELVGTFAGERTRRGDWFIGYLREGTTIVGTAEQAEIQKGRCYRFFGRTVKHERYGLQFNFTGFIEHRAPGKAGVVEYLTRNCPGIGPKIADQLFEKFGERAVEELRTNHAGCVDAIPKLAMDVAESAAEILKGLEKFEASKIELMEMFGRRGFPKNAADLAIKKWGPSAARLIRRNPYLTMKLPRVGFTRADELYLDLDGNPQRLKRQALCAWHALESDPEGHTWFPASKIAEHLKAKIGGAVAQPIKATKLAVRAGLLSVHQDESSRTYYANRSRADNEATVAAKLLELRTTTNQWPHNVEGVSEHQAGGLYDATLEPVGILGGSPGTGKTFTLAALIKRIMAADNTAKGWDEIQDEANDSIRNAFDDMADGGSFINPELIRARIASKYTPIYTCAPTGKAAVRASESLVKNGISLKARTIHSTLGVVPIGGESEAEDRWAFRYNARNKLPAGYLIIDEASMLDTDLAASLLSACPVGMHVLFVGDVNQLAPVGHGAPLRDMIAAGVSCGTLTEIRRNSGTIVRVCAEIKNGRRFDPAKKLELPTANLIHAEANTEDLQLKTLMGTLEEIRKSANVDLLRDVQILCTLNKKSKVSRTELNKLLQPLLNSANAVEGQKWWFGDKVICLKNSTLAAADGICESNDLSADDKGGNSKDDATAFHWIANGEIGFIEDVQSSFVVVRFSGPDRLVKIPAKGEDCPIDHGYAITCHKSQGSEWPVVLMLVDGSSGGNWIGCRELIYTAISRARDWCMTIGERRTIDKQCRKVSLRVRKTFLAEKTSRAMEELLVGMEDF